MKVRVTRHFVLTTEHDIPDGLTAAKLELKLALAAEDNCDKGVTALRHLAIATDAFCTGDTDFAIVYTPKQKPPSTSRKRTPKPRGTRE